MVHMIGIFKYIKENGVGIFCMLYFVTAVIVCIDIGFVWSSAALLLGSLCALSAGSGLKAAIYNSSLKLGLLASICIIAIGLLIVNSADPIIIKLGNVVLSANEWLLYGSLAFFMLTPRSMSVD